MSQPEIVPRASIGNSKPATLNPTRGQRSITVPAPGPQSKTSRLKGIKTLEAQIPIHSKGLGFRGIVSILITLGSRM